MLLLRVQPPARVQGTERLSEGGAQCALHERLVVRSRHISAQEQHRVCCQLWVRVASEDARPGRGGGAYVCSWSWSPKGLGRTLPLETQWVFLGNAGHTVGSAGGAPPPSSLCSRLLAAVPTWLLGLETLARTSPLPGMPLHHPLPTPHPTHTTAQNYSNSNFCILCESSSIYLCPQHPGHLSDSLPWGYRTPFWCRQA